MGTKQDFRCGDCGHGFSWISGDGRLTRVAHCRECGIAFALPRLDDAFDAPADADGADGRVSSAPDDPRPETSLHEVRTHCPCGGELDPAAPVRCGRCLGGNVAPKGPACEWE